MKRTLFLASAAIACMMLVSCNTTKTLYSWYDYENIAYKYQKRATDELQVKLIKQYEKMDQKQKATRGVVPPGFKAEYGYLLVKTGKKAEGIQMLKEEIALYPESKVYIERIVKQLEK